MPHNGLYYFISHSVKPLFMQLLKPAFTVLVDHQSQSILLLIRGTHSIKDTLTAVTGSVVPFHHTVLGDGGISNLVLGYAHCGMVAAARWIAKLSTSILTKALSDYPTYQIKVFYPFLPLFFLSNPCRFILVRVVK